MSELIKEIENDIAALQATLDKAKLLEDKFEFCGDGRAVFSCGSIDKSADEKTQNFAAIYKTEEQAIKRRRMLYLQNVEFQLAEHFNAGAEYGLVKTLYSIAFNSRLNKFVVSVSSGVARDGVSYFISEEAAEKALPYYIEAVERYDRGEV